jgi:hypothetical protein
LISFYYSEYPEALLRGCATARLTAKKKRD